MAVEALRIALTADDAPTLSGPAGADPSRMDALREILRERGVTHCVAFAIGARVPGSEAALERWLAAGYEVGNHGFDHLRASEAEPHAFLDSVARCDALLAALGAFDGGRRRWFRYPHLDRGRDPVAREELRKRIRELGYAVVHASVDLFDHRYERVLSEAEVEGDAGRVGRITRRYQETAWQGLLHVAERSRAHAGRPVAQIPFFHFGPVSERALGGLLDRLRALGAVWCPVSEAVADPVYLAFDRDPGLSGLVARSWPTPLAARLRRRLARLSERAGWFGQRRDGPRWPHWI